MGFHMFQDIQFEEEMFTVGMIVHTCNLSTWEVGVGEGGHLMVVMVGLASICRFCFEREGPTVYPLLSWVITVYTRLASISWSSACLCLRRSRIKACTSVFSSIARCGCATEGTVNASRCFLGNFLLWLIVLVGWFWSLLNVFRPFGGRLWGEIYWMG